MSGHNSNGDGNESDNDSVDSYFKDDDIPIRYNPQTKQYEKNTDSLVKSHKPIIFSDLYNASRAHRESEEQKLRDAVKAKVDDIIVLLQQHASKSSYTSSRQASTSTALGNPEPSLQEVEAEINALISNMRRQYISMARREGGGITELDHAMIAMLMQLRRELEGTPYAKILENFLETEIHDNSILIARGDSSDPFLHYLYEHPEDKATIGDDAYIQYRDAVDEHFISNTESSLLNIKVAEAGIADILGKFGGPRITAMSIALAQATESRETPKPSTPSHPRLD